MSDIYYEFGVNVLRDSENAGPTAAEVRMAREIESLRYRVGALERTLIRTSANLMAAISLMRAGGKYAVPSDKMFRKMLNDYEKAVQDGIEKLQVTKP
jgi:hypothetical protein